VKGTGTGALDLKDRAIEIVQLHPKVNPSKQETECKRKSFLLVKPISVQKRSVGPIILKRSTSIKTIVSLIGCQVCNVLYHTYTVED
jgi:hypothetical protein